MSETLQSLWVGSVPKPRAPSEIASVLADVASRHELTVDDLKGASRVQYIANARQEAMWALRSLSHPDGRPRLSLPRIAQIMGGRHHATVIHGCRAHERRIAHGSH